MNKQEFQELKRRAEEGGVESQHKLGRAYHDGDGVRKNLAEAFKWWLKAAEQGKVASQYNVGLCYDEGVGVKENKAEAAKWYLKAAEQGDNDAQFNLAVAHYCGYGVPVDYKEASKWFRKAAMKGDAKSQYFLGRMYDLGMGVRKDDAIASRWLNKAARQGHAKAIKYLKENSYLSRSNYTADEDDGEEESLGSMLFTGIGTAIGFTVRKAIDYAQKHPELIEEAKARAKNRVHIEYDDEDPDDIDLPDIDDFPVCDDSADDWGIDSDGPWDDDSDDE